MAVSLRRVRNPLVLMPRHKLKWHATPKKPEENAREKACAVVRLSRKLELKDKD
jgi:hypothetical protein